jgi:uncharacterized phiE125 gp8 family phage protein
VVPAEEPLSLIEAKNHLRVEAPEDDALIAALIAAARDQLEGETSRQLVTATWRLSLDCFPAVIRLPISPVQSVSSIQYLDANEVLQTLSASVYVVDTDRKPARIAPAYGEVWPTTLPQINAVKVTFVAGYGTPAAVPESIKEALKLMIGHWYENREASITGTIVTALPDGIQRIINRFHDGHYV